MTLSLVRSRHYLQTFDWENLFINEMGWDRHSAELSVSVEDQTFNLRTLAQKRGVQIFECPPDASGKVPDYATRRKIDKLVTKFAHEHLIILVDEAKSLQVWQWVSRQPGQPDACREIVFHPGHQSGDMLLQKLETITFPLSAEEGLSLTGVTFALRDAFDRDRLTKRFYDQFKKEHAAFLAFIRGITAGADREWYASLMLNRLMFIYFIQEKGFLDGEKRYLQKRLKLVQQRKGKGKFLTFYRLFLLRLFHEGFAQQPAQRSADLEDLLGIVPYLNGGLFDEHDLERKYSEIEIPDEAFEKIFEFFDKWDWTLDTRPLSRGNEINPDVLGYIFEKYINQKQMGAYYTKEDITEYISKNTVVPFLFDKAETKCAIAFQTGSALWRLLTNEPDRYLYPAMRKGVIDDRGEVIPLPAEIAKGVEEVSQRDGWNRPADTAFALPTETWREHVARRQRCLEVREKLAIGEIHQINDLITYNLDIRQFAEDVIESCEGPELLRAFYTAIAGRVPFQSNEHFEPGISILDPTCGSGAFLFAALRILEPLYEACLRRMQGFLEDLDRSGERHSPLKYADFRRILAEADKHPNRRYFILKSIIVNNLYGVDIMPEAIEICKLRLFLKLVAQVDKVKDLEPLPDIDFNIRAGNTLVGFATLDSVKRTLDAKLGFDRDQVQQIVEDAEIVDLSFQKFHQMQTVHGMDARDFSAAKKELRDRLRELAEKLDEYLAGDFGINAKKDMEFRQWKTSHHPFHWFAEFYGTMSRGGFNVVVGNPPYVELKEIKDYRPIGYVCILCANLYAPVLERCMSLVHSGGYQGFIVPVSSVSTDRYETLQKRLTCHGLWFSSFDDRPSRLFDGLEHIRLTIHIMSPRCRYAQLYSSRYNKWNAVERPTLFEQLALAESKPTLVPCSLPKLCSPVEHSILSKLSAQGRRLSDFYDPRGSHTIFYSRKVGYFLQVLNFEPQVLDGRGNRRPPSEFKSLCFGTQEHALGSLCCLNSNLFYWFVTVFSDCRHVNKREVDAFAIDLDAMVSDGTASKMQRLGAKLMTELKANSEIRRMRFAHDDLTVQCIIPKASKPIIDEIDSALAEHYGFTASELDFLINYDIKYRMGQNGEEVDE